MWEPLAAISGYSLSSGLLILDECQEDANSCTTVYKKMYTRVPVGEVEEGDSLICVVNCIDRVV